MPSHIPLASNRSPAAVGLPPSRRKHWLWLIPLAFLAGGAWLGLDSLLVDRRPIVVGILHSLSDANSGFEKSLIDAEVMALEEINRDGGLLGRPIRWVIADGGSDAATFAQQADRLIQENRACVIFGRATNAVRRHIEQLMTAADSLLVSPGIHPGLGESAHIVSTGPLPNQQIVPALEWCRESLAARRFFIVGDDDDWSRCAGAVAADQIESQGNTLAGSVSLPAGDFDVSGAVAAISEARPDVLLCLLQADLAATLARRLREAGLGSAILPMIMFAVGEDDLRRVPRDDLVGNYAASAYFQGIDRATDQGFVQNFKRRYGADRVTSESISSAYYAVYLWAGAVREAGTDNVSRVRSSIRQQSLSAPEGIIAIDPNTFHAWRGLSIGRLRSDGLFDPVWTSRSPIRPMPFPVTRSKAEWMRFLAALPSQRTGRTTPPQAPLSLGRQP